MREHIEKSAAVTVSFENLIHHMNFLADENKAESIGKNGKEYIFVYESSADVLLNI